MTPPAPKPRGRGSGGARSSTMSPMALLAALRKETAPPPLVLIHGDEPFLMTKALGILKDQAFPGGEGRNMNLDEFAPKEVDGRKVASIARTFSMFSPMRMIILRDAHAVSEGELTHLVPYVKDPAPHCCLVALADRIAGKDRSRPFFKAMLSQAKVLEFKTLWQNQVSGWIADRCREMGVRIDSDATDILAEVVGSNLAMIEDSLERLRLYAGRDAHITLDHVEECIADSRAHTFLDLGDALGLRDLNKALKILVKLRDSGEAPLALLAILSRRMRDYWLIRGAMAQSGGNLEAIKAVAGTRSDWYCRKLMEQARRFGADDFTDGAIAVHEADVRLKSSPLPGKLNDWVVMEVLIRRLCRKV